MIRVNVPASCAALAVSLVSVLAPIEAKDAVAQETVTTVAHTQPSAEDSLPRFVTREVVQPLPAAASAEGDAQPRAGSLSQLVARMDSSDMDEQMKCLAGAIYFESRGEPLHGQLAVAEVIKNRATSGRFPGSYCGVVHQKSQFSFVKGGRMPAIAQNAAYRTASAIAKIAHNDLWQTEAADALFFHARSVSPGWRGKVAVARISSHVFYR